MRIISGNYGGRRLKSLAGANTRPTTDKVKESIFNMIGPYFDGETVLDLFAGSGGLAIEAVSRGCSHAVCVDKNYQALKIIKENIDKMEELGLFSKTAVIVCETDKTVELPETVAGFHQIRKQIYGITAVTIYRKEGNQ